MLSQLFNRSTAILRKALGYRPIARFFATRSSFPCKVCQLRVSQLKGSVHVTVPSALREFLSRGRNARIARRFHGQPGYETRYENRRATDAAKAAAKATALHHLAPGPLGRRLYAYA